MSNINALVSLTQSNAAFALRAALAIAVTALVGCSDSKAGERQSVGSAWFALAADGGAETEGEHDHDMAAAGSAAPEAADAATPDAAAPDAATAEPPAEMPPAETVDAGSGVPVDGADDDGGTDVMPDAGNEMTDPGTEHCTMEMPPDPRDQTLDPAPVLLTVRDTQDVQMPQPVVDWMREQGWEPAHDSWHQTRVWDSRCGVSFAPAEDCMFATRLTGQQLWRAQFQQGGPGAGLAFLAMHRHMIMMFKMAFPSHSDLFRGFAHIPRSVDDPENPTPWRELSWSDNSLAGFDILEHIEDHLDMFPTDDDLGIYIESNVRWSPEDPSFTSDAPGTGVHGSLHRQWSVLGSSAYLGSFATALENWSFWKLHGWIDEVWRRYRAAKGFPDSDPDYQAVTLKECRLMYYLVPEHRMSAPPDIRN